MRFLIAGIGAAGVFLVGPAWANDVLLSQSFGSTPVGVIQGETPAAATGRFDFGPSGVTAHYNSSQGNARLVLPLSSALNQNQSFQMTATYVIKGTPFYADPNGFSQLSFGLINQSTTGFDRTAFTASPADDSYDSLSVEYFPNITSFFETPSFAVTALGTNHSNNLFGSYAFPPALEAGLSAEGDVPKDVTLTAQVNYDAAAHVFTLKLSDAGGPRTINTDGSVGGGYDTDKTTIQTFSGALDFNVDAMALLLWNDPYGSFFPDGNTDPNKATAVADITFNSVEVVATPEPGTLALASVAGLMLLRRKR